MAKIGAFYEKCWDLLARIPAGQVTTYAEIARALGSTGYRAVGSAMAKNDQLITRPCHRVVKSDGRIGGYALGTDKKERLLKNEGIEVNNGRVVCLDRYLYKFGVENS